MRNTVRRMISLSKQIPKMNDVTQKKGNGDLAAILHSYPVFTARLRDFAENPPESKETRGAKPKVFYSVEVLFLAHLVERLYKERGKPFSGSDRDRVKRCLEKGFSGESDFFDPLRSKMWIDMFSALDDQLHLFTPTETDGFADFFTNYIALYGKINNTKTVPFYGRWIRETAAMYTVYLHETYEEFETTAAMLHNALKEGIVLSENVSRQLRYETDAVRNHIMTNIFLAYGKEKRKVLYELCEYIRENPREFIYECGGLNKRYRRYYCTIREMLQWIEKQGCFSFTDAELTKIYSEDGVSLDLKDRCIRELEAAIVSELISLSAKSSSARPSDHEKLAIVRLAVDGKANFDTDLYSEILAEIGKTSYVHKRTVEQSVDAIVRLLRFTVMLTVLHQNLNEDEIPCADHVLSQINRVMKSFGLIPLPTHTVTGYNDSSLTDLCVVKFIEESFDD